MVVDNFYLEALFRKGLIRFSSSERGEGHRAIKLPQFPAGARVPFPSLCSRPVHLASGASENMVQVVKPIFMTLENHPGHCFQQLKIQ